MSIFDYIKKHVFGYAPVIKTKQYEKCEKKDNKDNKNDYIVVSSKTKSTLFLKLSDDHNMCMSTPIKRVIFTNVVGYENDSEDILWDKDYLKPKFVSLYFYDNIYAKSIESLKFKGYLSLLVAKGSVIDDIRIINQKGDVLVFIMTKHFKRSSVNSNIDKITIEIELFNVCHRTSDSIYSETSVPLTSPVASFINLNENDEIMLKFDISFTKSLLNDIESKAREEISERTNKIALKHTYLEWNKYTIR